MSLRLNRLSAPKNGRWLLLTVGLALAAATLLFLPFIIYQGGVFYYYGDFNVQEIPFYQEMHSLVHKGELGWNHLTDLGTDTLASYSFYLLGSPFFWLTVPFPNEVVPNLIGPLLILKFGCAAGAAYIYLQRYVKQKSMAVLGGLLYAFSGFSIYNVFFFHFHEPMIAFPLLLAALDAFLYEQRRGLFAVAVFGACVVNYYFFVGQALFVVLYYLMLTLTKTCRFRIREFLLLAAEVAIGFAATAFVLLPSVLGLLGNPRLNAFPHGWEALTYGREQKYWLIILSFLFPADLPAMPVFTPDSNCKWASVAGWLPLLGVTGLVAYLQLKKRDWIKKLILLLMLFAMVPVLNSMFQMMNSSIYYARWFYMLVLLFVLASVRAIEDKEADWDRAIIWSTGLTAGAAALIGLMPQLTGEEGQEELSIGVQSAFEKFWLYVLMALLSILVFTLIYKKFWHRRRFSAVMIVAALGVSLFSSFLVIGHGVMISGSTDSIKAHIINARDKIRIDDLEDVRSDFFEGIDNTAMFWQVPSINCFQSSVSTSIMQFYDKMGITRDVASRPDFSAYGLRTLVSCKYFFDDLLDSNDPETDNSFLDKDGNTKMPGWKKLQTDNKFDIYENENYVPMGFAFDAYVTQEEFERVKTANRTEAALNAMVLTRDQMKHYGEITGYYDKDYSKLYGDKPENFESAVDSYYYGEGWLKERAKVLNQNACSSFAYTKDGFAASFDNQSGRETLLFFSVPYSEGFSATVNGEAATVEKVTYGFMAVKVPQGKSEVVFTYATPGFRLGVLISLCAAAAFAAYMVLTIVFRQRRKRKSIKSNKETTDSSKPDGAVGAPE